MGSAIERRLEQACARISRVEPRLAHELVQGGALMIDTRPAGQRERFGVIPGAVVVERVHLEWRLDPTSTHRHPAVIEHHGPIVVFCQEGYSSILAVESLVDLGMTDVHELAGGFEAWAIAGLPTSSATRAGG